MEMRVSIIVVSSVGLAIVAAAAVILPELISGSPAGIGAAVLALLPTMVVTAAAAYALCAVLLVAGDLIADALRVRHDIIRILSQSETRPGDWTAALDVSGFRWMVAPFAVMPPASTEANGSIVLQAAFEPHQARRGVARRFYIAAARSQFFSALIVLAAGVVLGAAQSYHLPFLSGLIPIVPAGLAMAGLVLLGLLARIAVDVATEPLIETISRLPAETPEAEWLRRVAELLGRQLSGERMRDTVSPEAMRQASERLGTILEQDHRAMTEAIDRLSSAAEGLAIRTGSSLDAIEAAFRGFERRGQAATLNGAAETEPDTLTELRDAVRGLTAILQRVRETPALAEGNAEPPSSAPARAPEIAFELRRLLQEIGASP